MKKTPKYRISKSYKNISSNLMKSAMETCGLINKIDDICNYEISPYHRIDVIKAEIKRWRDKI